MNFTELGLRRELVRAVAGAGYTTPTSIQERGIPLVLDGHDLIACAQTGTGKTATFLLPILQHLAGGQASRHARALVVTPTRELAAQIGEKAEQYGTYLRLRSTVIFGGVGLEPQERRLAGGVDLLITTPGRILDHLGRKQVTLGNVEMVVLDEADRMLDMGFLPDVRKILATLPAERQNLFFSATMPGEIEGLIRRTTHAPVMVEVTRRSTPVSAIRQVVHPVAQTRKKELLKTLLQRADMGQTLVFTRTKARANQLVRRLEQSGRRIAVIHGNKSQNARARALAGFRTGKINTLIATDIAARGLDVDGISHVVNFDLPHIPEDYVHRIGRTARAGQSGDAISLAAPEERAQLAAIERLIGKPIRREHVAGFTTARSAVESDPQRRPKSPPARRTGRNSGDSARPAASLMGRVRTRRHARSKRARSEVTRAGAEARTVVRDKGSDASTRLEPDEALARPCQEEKDPVTLDRFRYVTAGFTRATVRVAMVRAIADRRLSTTEFTPRRRADYRRFYRAVLNRLTFRCFQIATSARSEHQMPPAVLVVRTPQRVRTPYRTPTPIVTPP